MHAESKQIIKTWLWQGAAVTYMSGAIVLTSPLVKYEHRVITVCLRQV